METLFIGQNAIFLPEVDSTNSYAISLLKNVNPFEGTVVYTHHQTNGRGQRGNTWISENGVNIAASVILKPSFLSVKNVYQLYIISALAVHDVLSQLPNSGQFDIKIKWPNDILVNGKKIAGILNETILQNNVVSAAVIGIGLNVNQSAFPDLARATSLQMLFRQTFDLKQILAEICAQLEKRYLQLKNGNTDLLMKEYLAHFYKLNEWQLFRINQSECNCLVKGISETGLLVLQDNLHNTICCDVKEAEWLL